MKHPIMICALLITPAAGDAGHGNRLHNPSMQCRWTHGEDGPVSLGLTDVVSNRKLLIGSGFTPVVILPDGTKLEIGPALSSFTMDARGNSRSATIKANPLGLGGRWSAALHEDPAFLVQTLTLEATRDLPIKEIVFLDCPLDQAEIMGQVDGSVLRSGPFFLAIEHPLAKLEESTAGNFRCVQPRNTTLRAGESWSYTFTIGTTPPGQFRRGFLRYLESRRAQPYRPFVHYNSWYHLNLARPGGVHMTEGECMDTIRHIGRELTEKRDVRLEAFVWDDGWDDHNSLWGFHDDFPRGFKGLREEAEMHGAGMGVWMSPWGGYANSRKRRLEFGKAQGYEINAGGFSMAGEKYGSAFRSRCFEMMDDHGAEFFKFDGMGGGNIVKGAKGDAAADIDAVLELTRALRRKNPKVFISATVGTWPSPFWLLYVDSIWRQGGDTGFAGIGNGREQWITYRDSQTRRNIVQQAPCYPISSLMTGGLVIGERANPARMTLDDTSVRHEARAMIGSGTCLQELYIAPHLLTQPMWDSIAESIKWLRSRRDAFADIHWVGGDPEALETYGWGGWHRGHAVLTIRNPSDQPAGFKLDIVEALDLPPSGLKTGYTLDSPYSDQRLRSLDCKPAEWRELELQPFEILSFDIAPANGASAFDHSVYQEWRRKQDAIERIVAIGLAEKFLGSWTYEHQGRSYTRTFRPDGSAQLSIDGEVWAGWPDRRWRIDGKKLIVTAPGAEPEPHLLDAKGRMILPAGLGLAEKQP